MNTTTVPRTRTRPADFDHVLATRQRVAARGDTEAVKQLAKRVPKRLTANQRDIIARTMRQHGGQR